MPPIDVNALLESKKGILLDISFGGTRQERSVTYGPYGDFDLDPAATIRELPANCVNTAIVTHVLEFIAPHVFYRWFDSLHYVMQPNGVVYFSGPYGGDESFGWISDPSHRIRIVEETFHWFDPATPFYEIHQKHLSRPAPKPWKILTSARVPGPYGTLSYNVTMQAKKEEAA